MANKKFKLDDNYLKITFSLSVLLFALSLSQTAFYIDRPKENEFSSVIVFAVGWMVFLAGNFFETLIWLANPLYLMTIILSGFSHRIFPIISAIFAIVLALLFLKVDGIATDESGSGTIYKITKLGPGYWLWLSAIAIAFFGLLMSFINKKHYSKS